MITAKIQLSADGQVAGFKVFGHAGYAEEGSDIICSAVSAICYTAVGYIDEKLRKHFNVGVEFEESDGNMSYKRDKLSRDNAVRNDIDAVLSAMVIGLKQVEESYGRNYLTLVEEENPNVEN